MLYLFVLAACPCLAREEKGVGFPETVTIQGTECKLIGVGVRKKLIINVYLGALYMAKPTQSVERVISTDQVKRVHMHFLYREVTADQLIEAWNEGFENNAGDSFTTLKDEISRFNGLFTESMKKDETIVITYLPGQGTEVRSKGEIKGVIEGQGFMKALFSIWFGPKPPSKGLKKGMLGG
ncbi:chalcone isomerase family protein [Candidatus Latescibacterota bacterium]